MKKLISLTAISLLISNAAMANSATDAISQVIEQYETALNASSSTDVIKLYGQGAVFMPQHAPAQIGKELIEKAYGHVFNTLKLTIDFTVHSIEVNGDSAWVRTSSAGKTKILANNQVVNEGNNELFIFKKEQGEWKIHQYIFSTNQPR